MWADDTTVYCIADTVDNTVIRSIDLFPWKFQIL